MTYSFFKGRTNQEGVRINEGDVSVIRSIFIDHELDLKLPAARHFDENQARQRRLHIRQ